MTTMEEQYRLDMEYDRRLREAETALETLSSNSHHMHPAMMRNVVALLQDLEDERARIVRRWD